MDQPGNITTGVIKLEGQRNWNLWKFQISVLMRGMDIYSVTTGTDVKTEENAEEWSKKDGKAQSLIVTRLSEGAMLHILTCQTASAMWSKLHSVYEQKSSTSVHMQQQRFFNLKFDDGSDMPTFLARIQEMTSQLKEAGEGVSEKLIVTKVLMALPDKYKHFISAWESVDPAKQLYDELVGRLLVEEDRMKSRGSDFQEDVAMATARSKGNFKCFKCGRPGHFSKNCNSNNVSIGKKCFTCNQVGHFKRDCPKRKGNALNSNGNAFIANALFLKEFSENNNNWIADSGASEHMTFDRNLFITYNEMSEQNRFVVVGDGRRLPVVGIGDIRLKASVGKSHKVTTLGNVLHVLGLKVNLFSIPCAVQKGYKVRITVDSCLLEKENMICATAHREGPLYVMDFIFEHSAATVLSLNEWHERLCHQGVDYVKNLLNKNGIKFNPEYRPCTACLEGKLHRLPFKEHDLHTTKVLQLVHADVCGPMEVESVGGSKYFLLIKDDFSNYRQVFFLKCKSEVINKFKKYITCSQNQTQQVLKVIRTDNGKEFVNKEVQQLFDNYGIIHQTTVPYTPEQNGKAERDMRTLVEAARCMLGAKGLGKEMWAEAINMAVYVLNRTSKSRLIGKTPYQVWEGVDHDINELSHVFGSEVYVHIPKQKRLKWDSKGEKGIFVGYEGSKGFRIYYPDTRGVFIKRDVLFIERKDQNNCERSEIKDSMIDEQVIMLDIEETMAPDIISDNLQEESDVSETSSTKLREERDSFDSNREVEEFLTDEGKSEDSSDSSLEKNEIVKTRSGREVKKPRKYDFDYGMIMLENEPQNYREAMSSDKAGKWQEAIDLELQQLTENNTWTLLSEVPEGMKVVSTKWVFKEKKGEGNESKFKARLVARGFEQSCDDIYDLYAPVAKLNTFRVFIAVATKLNLQVGQMDVCSAFLNSEINEEVYLKLPEGVNCSEPYCKLNKSIYGLKRSPKYWNTTFDKVMLTMGFKKSEKDNCLYTKCEGNKRTFLLLYVDDIIYFGNCKNELLQLRNKLLNTFKMKDMGKISKFLGIEINQDLNKGCTTISQKEYLENLLKSYGMSDCKQVLLPIDKNFKFSLLNRDKSESKEIEFKCRKLIGNLMYAVVGSRPDLCTIISVLSRYQTKASRLLYKLLLNVLRYVKGTLDMSLTYRRDNNSVEGFVDSDWGGSDDRRSTTGCCFKVFGCSVIWFTKKQQSVALSSTEAEYVALCHATSEACWLQQLLLVFGFSVEPITMYEDNQSTIKIAHMAGNCRVKHLEIKQSFVKEKLNAGIIKLVYVCTSDQLGDMFTKPLGGVQFKKLRDKLFN